MEQKRLPPRKCALRRVSTLFTIVRSALMTLPSLASIQTAAELVHRVMLPTPQIRWPLLCARFGAEAWVKHENHSPVGAFKVDRKSVV